MGLDLWFPEDVVRMMAAIEATMISSINAVAVTDSRSDEYQRGFMDALDSMRAAFGLPVRRLVGYRSDNK